MTEKLTPPKEPCGSCPYRKDVPAGIWTEDEYQKLPPYDRETWAQPRALFMCHQNDGCLCGGWVACHGNELLALRIAGFLGTVDPAISDYHPKADLFASGQEACDHGIAGIEDPDAAARRKIEGLMRQRARRASDE